MLCAALAALAAGKLRNSPIHFVKLKNYGNGIDLRSVRDLARVFSSRKENIKERDKTFKGRKIAWKDEKATAPTPLNIIPLGVEHKIESSVNKIATANPDQLKMSENEILRPEINFTSNARPAMLKWRELKIEKTPIIKPLQEKYRSRLKKKYGSSVPVHLGHSRKFIEYPGLGTRAGSTRLPGTPLTWLPTPIQANGIPRTILHFKYPLKIKKLSSNSIYYQPRRFHYF